MKNKGLSALPVDPAQAAGVLSLDLSFNEFTVCYLSSLFFAIFNYFSF